MSTISLKQKLHEERKARLARFNAAAEQKRRADDEKNHLTWAQQLVEQRLQQERMKEQARRDQWRMLEKMFDDYVTITKGKMQYSKIVTQMIAEITEETGYSLAEIRSPRRQPELVRIRQELYWRIYKHTDWSLPRIGEILNRDHTTILYGIRQVEKRKKASEQKSDSGVSEKDRRGTGMHVRRSAEDTRGNGRDVLPVFGSPC